MTTAKTDDARKGVNTTIDQVRTPLLAALGAGNLAGHAVVEAVSKAKERVAEGSENARKSLEELPSEVGSLREKLDPTELRKVIDEYTEAALKLYNKLAESGEQTWDKIVAQPQFKKAFEQVEEVLTTAQGRVEGATAEARERVEDALARVTRKTRSSGEKAARKVQAVAEASGDQVQQLGDEVAQETRSVSRKVANKTAPRAASTTRRSTPAVTRKPVTPKPRTE
jgi:heparin binding hemagglutinin HbhA